MKKKKKLAIVVGKLAEVSIVDTDDFGLFASSQPQSGDEMKQPTDDGGHDKGVSETSCQIGHLVAGLYPVMADPASGNVGDAVKASHRALGK